MFVFISRVADSEPNKVMLNCVSAYNHCKHGDKASFPLCREDKSDKRLDKLLDKLNTVGKWILFTMIGERSRWKDINKP